MLFTWARGCVCDQLRTGYFGMPDRCQYERNHTVLAFFNDSKKVVTFQIQTTTSDYTYCSYPTFTPAQRNLFPGQRCTGVKSLMLRVFLRYLNSSAYSVALLPSTQRPYFRRNLPTFTNLRRRFFDGLNSCISISSIWNRKLDRLQVYQRLRIVFPEHR